MYRAAVAIVVALWLVACGSVETDSSGASVSAPFAEFRSEIADIADDDGIVGLSYAIVDSDGVLVAEGLGLADVEAGRAVTLDTLFHIGSTHKAMNAALVATLVDDGLIDWDTPVADVLVDYDIDPDMRVRHTLHDGAGFRG